MENQSDKEPSPEVILSRKNTAAFKQAIDHLTNLVYEQQKKIDGMQSAINSLTEKNNSLEQMLQIQKVLSAGRGPSVK